MQEAIREEHLDGWLFCNFAHRDRLTDSLLELPPDSVSSRRWFYLIPDRGQPVKIVHSIERGILDTLPGGKTVYSGRYELAAGLSGFAGLTVAVLCDPDIQVLSTIDAASYLLVRDCGLHPVSAAALLQRFKGIMDAAGTESHERAARVLYRLVSDSWDLVRAAFRTGEPVSEGDIQDFMLDRFKKEGLVTDHPPIVATGSHSGDPHYDVPGKPFSARGRGSFLAAGDVVQFDLWARYPGGIFADISWVGYCGKTVPETVQRRFGTLLRARDLVKPAIEKALAAGNPVTGSELDAQVRAFLLQNVPPEAVRHRTGHGIDTDCHGSGVNLDSYEFPDTRRLLEGSCFSVEPGIYFDDAGFRTEINIYIHGGKPVISGGEIQTVLLTLQE